MNVYEILIIILGVIYSASTIINIIFLLSEFFPEGVFLDHGKSKDLGVFYEITMEEESDNDKK